MLGEAAAINDRVEHYRPQIDAYRQAVAQFMRLAPASVVARLVFVEPAVVRPVV